MDGVGGGTDLVPLWQQVLKLEGKRKSKQKKKNQEMKILGKIYFYSVQV